MCVIEVMNAVVSVQGYSGKGVCVRCGSDLVSSRHSTHWEGGQGCRNKAKMSK